MCTIARSDEITINWMNTDKTIDHTTTCTIGGDVNVPIPTKYGYTFNGWVANYTPIEYLESTGTQWIDINYYANPNTKIHFDFALSTKQQDNRFIFYGGWVKLCFGLLYKNGRFYHCSYDDGGTNDLAPSNQTAELVRYRVIFDARNHVESWPGITFQTKTVRNSTVADLLTTQTSNETIKLFGVPENKLSLIKLYEFKLWDNGILIYDMIPVLDSNNVPCMYDRVEGRFYYNAGTGQFIAGPVIGE